MAYKFAIKNNQYFASIKIEVKAEDNCRWQISAADKENHVYELRIETAEVFQRH